MLAVSGIASFVYAFRNTPRVGILKNLMVVAAALDFDIVPWTLIVMMPTNNELHRRANAASAGNDETVDRKDAKAGSIPSYDTTSLVRRWNKLNIVRAMFHVGSIVCALTLLAV